MCRSTRNAREDVPVESCVGLEDSSGCQQSTAAASDVTHLSALSDVMLVRHHCCRSDGVPSFRHSAGYTWEPRRCRACGVALRNSAAGATVNLVLKAFFFCLCSWCVCCSSGGNWIFILLILFFSLAPLDNCVYVTC